MTESSLSARSGDVGVLWRYAVDGHGQGISLSADEPLPQDTGFEWVHLQSDAPGALSWLQNAGLDDIVADTLTASETRPRAFTHKEGVLLILRGVNMKPGADPEDMVALRIWFTATRIVTARRRERLLLSLQDMRDTVDRGLSSASTGEFVTVLVEKLASRIGDVVDEIDESLTQIEDGLGNQSMSETRRALSEVRRQAAAIRRYLAPQREALETLYRTKNLLSDAEAFMLRDQTDRTTRYVEDLDLARERAIVLQEELQNRVAEQQNARMYVLSIVSAVFLPLSFLTGVFGMNVAGLPGVENPRSFGMLVAWMVGLAIALLGFMKWKKWL